jgi:hypothetical protein
VSDHVPGVRDGVAEPARRVGCGKVGLLFARRGSRRWLCRRRQRCNDCPARPPDRGARAARRVVHGGRPRQRAIRELGVGDVIRTIVGTGARAFSIDGAAATASAIADPLGLASDLQGRRLFTDSATRRFRRIEVDGTLRTIVGTGISGLTADGDPPEVARLTTPRSLDVDASGRSVLRRWHHLDRRRSGSSGNDRQSAGVWPCPRWRQLRRHSPKKTTARCAKVVTEP